MPPPTHAAASPSSSIRPTVSCTSANAARASSNDRSAAATRSSAATARANNDTTTDLSRTAGRGASSTSATAGTTSAGSASRTAGTPTGRGFESSARPAGNGSRTNATNARHDPANFRAVSYVGHGSRGSSPLFFVIQSSNRGTPPDSSTHNRPRATADSNDHPASHCHTSG